MTSLNSDERTGIAGIRTFTIYRHFHLNRNPDPAPGVSWLYAQWSRIQNCNVARELEVGD